MVMINQNVMAPAQMIPGDVLLYRGDSLIGRAIRAFDGRPVNHAAIYTGTRDGGPPRIAEAWQEGVVENLVADSLNGNIEVWVRRLVAAVGVPAVADEAHKIVLQRHSYSNAQIVLLAMLAITRKVPNRPWLKVLVRKILDAAASRLLNWIQNPAQASKPMICSEFVYRCYENVASSSGLLNLQIQINPAAACVSSSKCQSGSLIEQVDEALLVLPEEMAASVESPARLEEDVVAELQANLEALEELERTSLGSSLGLSEEAPLSVSDELRAAMCGFVPRVRQAFREPEFKRVVEDFVTPGDLWDALNLTTVGRVR